MPKTFEVIVAPDGTTTVQTKGYAGSECQQASQWLEQALGITIGEYKTPEYFQTASQEQQQEARQ